VIGAHHVSRASVRSSSKKTTRVLNVVVFREETSLPKLPKVRFIACRALRIRPVKTQLRVAKETVYDYLLVTSQNALRYLKWIPNAKTWVFMGKATARIARKRMKRNSKDYSPKAVVLKVSDSRGILDYFHRIREMERGGQKQPQPIKKIFFPRSELADKNTASELRRLGYQVRICYSYRTEILSVRRQVLQCIKKFGSIDAFFITSPSVLRALEKSFSKAEIRIWKERMLFIAIGKTSFQALKDREFRRAVCAPAPRIMAMVMAMAKTLASYRD